MSLYVDTKYISLVSNKLNRFVKKGTYTYNCRCPFCGDSKKSKLKARGYFIRSKNRMYYKCHNCGLPLTIEDFLEKVDHNLYSQYKLESYKERNNIVEEKVPDYSAAKVKPMFDYKITLPKIKDLPDDHIAKQYVMQRRIPEFHWDRMYFAKDFLAFCDDMYPEHGKNLPRDDMRLVIPFWDGKKILQGVQGRTLCNSEVRYITIRCREDMIKVFGLDIIDTTKPIYITEGPIDSMFLPNALATMDSTLTRIKELFGDHDYIFVHDNEPRNKEILKSMNKSIASGKKVFFWPDIPEKDINELAMTLTPADIKSLIDRNTYSGLAAQMKMTTWRKV